MASRNGRAQKDRATGASLLLAGVAVSLLDAVATATITRHFRHPFWRIVLPCTLSSAILARRPNTGRFDDPLSDDPVGRV